MYKKTKVFNVVFSVLFSTVCFAEAQVVSPVALVEEFKAPSGSPIPNLMGRCQRADTIAGLSSFIGSLGPAEDFRVVELKGKKYFVNYSNVSTPQVGFINIHFFNFDTLLPASLEEVLEAEKLSQEQEAAIKDKLLYNRPGLPLTSEAREQLAKVADALRSDQCLEQMLALKQENEKAKVMSAGAGTVGEVIFTGTPVDAKKAPAASDAKKSSHKKN